MARVKRCAHVLTSGTFTNDRTVTRLKTIDEMYYVVDDRQYNGNV
jgi:hypothetical protein